MSHYAIGDVQGCYRELQDLLSLIAFNPLQDTLWFAGDLVNRGTDSLSTLRFIRDLGEKHITVLGNHDLHLLALFHGVTFKGKHTLAEVLAAPDAPELMHWLQTRLLMHDDVTLNYVLSHAGVCPLWSLENARLLAREVESVLRSAKARELCHQMYGNTPTLWNDQLTGFSRLKCIIDYFTRMRYLTVNSELDFAHKDQPGTQPTSLFPWYVLPRKIKTPLIFGHWAALDGHTGETDVFAIDTGCAWGRRLTALRLEDRKIFQVNKSFP